MAISTIRRAIAELSSQELPDDGRIRCAGAGRKPAEETYPDVVNLVQEILDDEIYGSPKGGKWTSCSLRNITKALSDKGITIEKSTVQRIVKELGYSRQKNRKMEQVGDPDPDRGKVFSSSMQILFLLSCSFNIFCYTLCAKGSPDFFNNF